MNELLWVAVPGGQIAAGRATLRVLVVPRLSGGRLDAHGMADWPAVLRASTLTVEIAPPGGAPVTEVGAELVDRVQPDLWSRFFAPGMPVAGWQPREYHSRREADGPVVRVAESSNHLAAIQAVYAPAARAGGDPEVIRTGLETQRAALGAIDTGPQADPAPVAQEWTEPDFHRAVALLREHPSVLAALGLIVELSIAAGELPATDPSGHRLVRVRCQPGPGLVDAALVSPWTRYQHAEQRFVPAPRSARSDLTRGMLDLAAAHWQLATFDVTGGADRLRDALRSTDAGEPPGLPALRSAGVSVLRHRRAEVFADRLDDAARHAALPSLAGAELAAEDLVLGYRVDVRDEGAPWRPLCERSASYFVDGEPVGVPASREEGHVKAHAASATGPGERLLADEVVLRWDGWSLALPRPAIERRRPRGPRRGSMPYDFRWDFRPVPGAPLPQLRFGHRYQVRVRVADMAGGGLRPGDQIGDGYASRSVTYQRHEPVPPPELPPPPGVLVPDPRAGQPGRLVVDHAALGPGGSVELLVVRSDPAAGLGPEAFTGPAYPANDRRLLLPPPGSFALAEQHGLLDGADQRTASWVARAVAPPSSTPDGGYSWLPDPVTGGVVLCIRPEPGSPAPGQRVAQSWDADWPDLPAKSLRLRPLPPVDGQTAYWPGEDREALVDLAPAEQATLEISSYPRSDDIDSLEAKLWLGAQDDALIRDGRHPMVTPARVVRLVHAVRKPLGTFTGTLVTGRAALETTAVVTPEGDDPLLGVHPGSTAQVDLTASWDEVHDDQRTPTGDRLATSVPVAVDAPSLPELRHEFGDTRHRRVTYTMTALSRFRQFFPGGDDPATFTARHTFPQVRVLSTARPPAPVVLATTPAFVWLDESAHPGEVRRSRLGGRLRVELARPWHLSGEGEMLAAVVWPAGAGALPQATQPFVTRIRRDPIWATPDPAGTAEATMFADARPADAVLAETGEPVQVLPYPVTLVGDRWYADVALPDPARTSYCPFVRLAVARFQPDSLPGLELSGVVTTELVQLFPNRLVVVSADGPQVQVTLAGLGPVGPPNRVVATLERLAGPAGAVPADLTAAAPGAGQPVPAWVPVPGHAVEGRLDEPLPALPRPPGEGPLRVVVREVEQIAGGWNPVQGVDPVAAELTERTVFLDVVPLPA